MVIKFNDKFDSILPAVLYSNLTGYYLCSKNEPTNLLLDEPSVDIDKLDWQEIILNHNYKFGEIKWLNESSDNLAKLKKEVDFVFRYWQPFKYKIVISIIRSALKYGLEYCLSTDCFEYQQLLKCFAQVKNEAKQALGLINFLPFNCNQGKFLLGYYQSENRVGDLIINQLANKYFDYNFLLTTPAVIFVYYHNQTFEIPSQQFTAPISSKSFKQFWPFFQSHFLLEQHKQILI